MNIPPLEIFLGIAIIICIFLLLREWFTWYWKITAILSELKFIRLTLDRITQLMESDRYGVGQETVHEHHVENE